MIISKICSDCKIDKEMLKFSKNSTRKYGRNNVCKECVSFRSKENYKKNKLKINARHKQNYLKKYEYYLNKHKNYYHDNKDKAKEYRLKNIDKIRFRINQYQLNKKRTNINFYLMCILRGRLNKAIKKDTKSGSAIRDLGCSISELKIYLESKFQPGMTWKNRGLYGWHIDHIKPLSKFDLTDREQLKKACNYTNLQPLWAKDNLSKGCK